MQKLLYQVRIVLSAISYGTVKLRDACRGCFCGVHGREFGGFKHGERESNTDSSLARLSCGCGSVGLFLNFLFVFLPCSLTTFPSESDR